MNPDYFLIKESKDFSTRLSSSSFFMRHYAIGGWKKNMTELTGGQEVHNPLFNFIHLYIKTRTDNSNLVNTTNEFYNNLVGAMIINNLKLSNITYFMDNRNKVKIVRRYVTSIQSITKKWIKMWQVLRRNSFPWGKREIPWVYETCFVFHSPECAKYHLAPWGITSTLLSSSP